jgi:hypothetical protein
VTARRSLVRESVIASWVRPFLEQRGFEVRVNPDGSDYFDLVALRGDEVGLVELKVADWRTVLRQAVDRRDWADWVAVALPRVSLARRVLERTHNGPGLRVGVWAATERAVTVLRPATAFGPSGNVERDRWRLQLRTLLEESRGAWRPGELRWSVGRTTPRRGAWRLDEFATSSAGPPGVEEAKPRDEGRRGQLARAR